MMNETKRNNFKKATNKNNGAGIRGIVQVDITAPSEELADEMEAKLTKAGFESACYGDDLGNDGYLFSMMVKTSEMKDFNHEYNKAKKEAVI